MPFSSPRPSRLARAFALSAAAAIVLTAGCGATDLEEDLVNPTADGGAIDSSVGGHPGVDGSMGHPGQDAVTGSDVIVRRFDTGKPGFDAPHPVDSPPPMDEIRRVFDVIIDVPKNDTGKCGDGACDNGESCTTCPDDCGFCQSCGDGNCDPDESCSSCPADCGACESCGDGFCDNGETCTVCPQDCGQCVTCGDGNCDMRTENCTNCPQDCGKCASCPSGNCGGTESCISCPEDCGSCAFCGNGKCESSAGETCNSCAADCGSCPVAVTCSAILDCAMGCFSGGIGGFSLSCIADCDANACTQAKGFADAATNCLIQAFLDGTCGFGGGGGGSGGSGGGLQCALNACATPIAECLASAPCPGSGGSG